jgi:hypothetical protein
LENNVVFKIFPYFEKYALGIYVTTQALGLQPKEGLGKMRAENATWESHSHSSKCKRV